MSESKVTPENETPKVEDKVEEPESPKEETKVEAEVEEAETDLK